MLLIMENCEIFSRKVVENVEKYKKCLNIVKKKPLNVEKVQQSQIENVEKKEIYVENPKKKKL